MNDPETVEALRVVRGFIWKYVRKTWDGRCEVTPSGGPKGLALTEQSWQSEVPKEPVMANRPSLHRSQVKQCV